MASATTPLVHSASYKTLFTVTVTSVSPNSSSDPEEITMDTDSLTQRLSDQMVITLLPAIIIISIVMIISCIGNTMVFYVYLKKFNASSTRSAILALALLDLIAGCIAMPGEIIDIRFSFNFKSEITCKCIRFGTTAVLIASGFTLLVVAIDRYRRICHPTNDQLTASQAKKWVLGCFIAAIVCSVPAAIIYGLAWIPTPLEGVHGLECSIDHRYHNHILPLIYNIIQCSIFGSVVIAIIVLYSLLGRQVLQQNKFRHSICYSNQANRDHSITDGTRDGEAEENISPEPYFNPDTPVCIISKNQKVTPDQKKGYQTRRFSFFKSNRKATNGDVRTRKTTLMLFFISIFFVASFLPHLILKGIQAINKDYPRNSSTSDIVLYNIFVRSYFFNSMANCFIYGFCSAKFRKESKKVVLRILCCCK